MKTQSVLLIALCTAAAHGQVNVAGTVLDNYTKKGIPGAAIKLMGRNLAGSADADGVFTISDAAHLTRQDGKTSQGLVRSGRVFLFNQKTGCRADVRISPVSGRRSVPVYSGNLEPGLWRIDQPDLPSGLYVCIIRTPQAEHAMKFLSSGTGGGARAGNMERIGAFAQAAGSNAEAAAKRSARSDEGDTLLVSKPGYHQRKVPLDNLFREGLTILMTDTAVGKTATVVPDASWNCGMPGGIAPPAKGTLVFQATLAIGAIHDVGLTQYGYRRLLDVTGGSITGSRINGTVLTGGLDLELTQSDGTVELEQINVLRTNDGASIYVRSLGVALAGDPTGRVILDFEAPISSSYAWLNTGTYAGTRVVDASGKSVKLAVYDISNVAAADPKIRITDPETNIQQSPNCLKLTGTRGATVFTENVTLGASFSIASKRGNRNIIPITGGTTTGRVAGKILAGGADYQLGGLDARYTLAPSDGEFILVRNCGGMGSLVPQFEARTDGPYVFLNSNNFLSSDPGVGGGGVSITFYERN